MHPLALTHKAYTTLLHRVGRCLSFGCSPQQTQRAAALASRLTRAWPAAFLAAEGYVPLARPRVETPAGEGEDGVVAAAEASNRMLLSALLGEGRFVVARDDVQIHPVPVRPPLPTNYPFLQSHLRAPLCSILIVEPAR